MAPARSPSSAKASRDGGAARGRRAARRTSAGSGRGRGRRPRPGRRRARTSPGSSALVRLTRPSATHRANSSMTAERVAVALPRRGLDVLAAHERRVAAGDLDDAPQPAADGRLAGQLGQPGARRVALPAAPPPARARRAVGVDDHVAELAGEPVGPDDQPAAGDDAAADAGAERHQHHVVDAPPGADAPLGERGARGVVVDARPADRVARRAGRRRRARSTSGMFGDARSTPSRVTSPGTPDADGVDGPGSDSSSPTISASASISASPPRGRRPTGLGDERRRSASIDDAEALRAADVDAERPGGHAAGHSLGAGLELAHRVEDAHLGPPLDESGQRRGQLDRQVVAHLGAAVGGRREVVGALDRALDVALDHLPGEHRRAPASSRRPACSGCCARAPRRGTRPRTAAAARRVSGPRRPSRRAPSRGSARRRRRSPRPAPAGLRCVMVSEAVSAMVSHSGHDVVTPAVRRTRLDSVRGGKSPWYAAHRPLSPNPNIGTRKPSGERRSGVAVGTLGPGERRDHGDHDWQRAAPSIDAADPRRRRRPEQEVQLGHRDLVAPAALDGVVVRPQEGEHADGEQRERRDRGDPLQTRGEERRPPAPR